MNAIISFCHFCEQHGPSVVFCTQAYKNNTPFESFKYGKQTKKNDEIPNDFDNINKVGQTHRLF